MPSPCSKCNLFLFWVIPRRLSSNCRRFGTNYRFHLHNIPVFKLSPCSKCNLFLFWVITRRLSSNYRRFGTHYRFHLHNFLVFKLSHCSKCNLFLFWVIPRRLSSNCRRFGTHYRFHLHRQVNEIFIHLPMKMEPILSTETSAIRTQTTVNYPKKEQIAITCSCSIRRSSK